MLSQHSSILLPFRNAFLLNRLSTSWRCENLLDANIRVLGHHLLENIRNGETIISIDESVHASNCFAIHSTWWVTTFWLMVCVCPHLVRMGYPFIDMPFWHQFIGTVNSTQSLMNFHLTHLFCVKKFNNSSYFTIGGHVLLH